MTTAWGQWRQRNKENSVSDCNVFRIVYPNSLLLLSLTISLFRCFSFPYFLFFIFLSYFIFYYWFLCSFNSFAASLLSLLPSFTLSLLTLSYVSSFICLSIALLSSFLALRFLFHFHMSMLQSSCFTWAGRSLWNHTNRQIQRNSGTMLPSQYWQTSRVATHAESFPTSFVPQSFENVSLPVFVIEGSLSSSEKILYIVSLFSITGSGQSLIISHFSHMFRYATGGRAVVFPVLARSTPCC